MCYKAVHISPVSRSGSTKMFVPCGHCEDCKDTARKAWSFRLCAEIEQVKLDGWLVGFCTLTYNRENMPTIPKVFFADPETAPDVPCMNKAHCRLFIQNLRKRLWRDYRITDIKYMICSEFGDNPKDPENPHRPHYHMVIAWNPMCSKAVANSRRRVKYALSGEKMHELIKHYWTYGFLFPRYPSGGIDSEGYRHKSFVVENAGIAAGRYAGKYCCKDIHFSEMVRKLPDLTDDEVNLKFMKSMYYPFHIQSQSLGFSAIRNMSEVQKFDVIMHGMQFMGETSYAPAPVYIKNKILFTPHYMIDEETGRRCVRRDRTEFFAKYKYDIFQKKVVHYQELLREAQNTDFWLTRLRNEDSVKAVDIALKVQQRVNAFGFNSVDLASDYLAFYGVAPDRCYDVDRCEQWFMRYNDVFEVIDEYGEVVERSTQPIFNRTQWPDDVQLMDIEYLSALNDFWTGFFELLVYTNGVKKFDYEVDKVKSFFKEYGYAV